jgi:hypothetical protein
MVALSDAILRGTSRGDRPYKYLSLYKHAFVAQGITTGKYLKYSGDKCCFNQIGPGEFYKPNNTCLGVIH